MKKNILIVDDEEIIISNLAILIEDLYDEVFVAYNGLEALDLLLSNKEINLIVSDINMPIMDGVELIKKVREHKLETPFIFFTAHGNDKLMLEAVKYGAYDFIDKPLFQDLEEVIEKGFEYSFKIKNGSQLDKEETISEYRKLLGDV